VNHKKFPFTLGKKSSVLGSDPDESTVLNSEEQEELRDLLPTEV